MSLLSDTYDPDFEPTILTPYCCVISREEEKKTFIVFGLILLGFKRTIYSTWGEHVHNYTTEAVKGW